MARVRLALLALSLVAAPLGAQQPSGRPAGSFVSAASSEQVSSVTSVTRGPTLESAMAAARAPQPAALREAPAQKMALGQARALMIVGGAALLAGAIIGDDPGAIIMVGGAVVGLIGLYEYLQ